MLKVDRSFVAGLGTRPAGHADRAQRRLAGRRAGPAAVARGRGAPGRRSRSCARSAATTRRASTSAAGAGGAEARHDGPECWPTGRLWLLWLNEAMADIVMPRLSDSMEEGTIVKWLVADGRDGVARRRDRGDRDRQGDDDLRGRRGRRALVVAAEGDTLPIGEVIARLNGAGGGGRAPTDARAGARRGGRRPRPAPSSTPAAAAEEPPVAGARPPPAPTTGGGRVKASPIARRIAARAGVDLAPLTGTGPGGRIVKADVESAGGQAAGDARRRARSAPPPPRSPPPAAAKGEVDDRGADAHAAGRSRGGWPSPRRPCPTSRSRSTSTWRRRVSMRAQLKEARAPRASCPPSTTWW